MRIVERVGLRHWRVLRDDEHDRLVQRVADLEKVAGDYQEALQRIRLDNAKRPRQIAAAVLTRHAGWGSK